MYILKYEFIRRIAHKNIRQTNMKIKSLKYSCETGIF